MKRIRIFTSLILFVILLIFSSYTYFPQPSKVKVTHIGGSVEFTNKYNPNACMSIPAAYTGYDGKIEGQYRINGKTYGGQGLKERVSLHPQKGLIIGRDWMSGNGFQQHVLVKSGKVRHFKDKRRFRRRALCSDDSTPGSYLIIESTRRMTMNDFAIEVARYSKNAVNLDMGRWGYGWIGNKIHSPWAILFKNWQTNWIIIK